MNWPPSWRSELLIFDHQKLRAAVAAVFDAAGVEADIARAVADLLVDANLSGP